jgi:hypothetical protein
VYANNIVNHMECEPNLPKCSKNIRVDRRRSKIVIHPHCENCSAMIGFGWRLIFSPSLNAPRALD